VRGGIYVIGEKEKIIKEILSEMALDSESSFQLECVLSRVLYDYSLQKIESTQITTRDENLNDEAYRMFFISKGIKGLSKRTLQYYKYTIDKFRTIVDKPFQEVEPNDIRYFLAVIKMQGHYNEVSLNNERRNISAFFGWMADNEYITRNPVRRVEKVKEKKNVKKPLKDTEIEILQGMIFERLH
jgi:integrase/recombinase XerD